MADTQGIIFSDIFITNKTMFINFFSEYYRGKEAILAPIVKRLQDVLNQFHDTNTLTEKFAADFKPAWQNFQNYVLLNTKDLELLVAFRGSSGQNATFSQIVPQSSVEGQGVSKQGVQYGIQTAQLLERELLLAKNAKKVEEFLQHHLNNFLEQLKEKITHDEATNIHRHHEYCLISSLQNTRIHLTNRTWINSFYTDSYGAYYSGRGLGQAYDAFMNHLANKESGIYNYLRSQGAETINGEKFNITTQKTVYEEERGVLKIGTFAELLHESRNTIGWYTGGDIIIVDPATMAVVYNIQLKTTGKNTLSIFPERIGALRNFINNFVGASPEQKGKILFEFFITSVSNKDAFNKIPSSEINKITKEHLNNIKVSII